MALTYSTYVSSLQTLMPTQSGDINFEAILPDAIDYAELRIQRDLNLLQTQARATGSLSSGNRNFTLPNSSSNTASFVVTNGFNIITPAGTTDPEAGTRNPVTLVSRDVLDAIWPSSTGSTVPNMAAMITQFSAVFGPWPDAAYTVEVIGTTRLPSISAVNTTTFISTYFPDMLLSASMVFIAGYMKNYGAQADDPKMAQSWESQYQTQKASATVEEYRKMQMGSSWTPLTQSPQAQPART